MALASCPATLCKGMPAPTPGILVILLSDKKFGCPGDFPCLSSVQYAGTSMLVLRSEPLRRLCLLLSCRKHSPLPLTDLQYRTVVPWSAVLDTGHDSELPPVDASFQAGGAAVWEGLGQGIEAQAASLGSCQGNPLPQLCLVFPRPAPGVQHLTFQLLSYWLHTATAAVTTACAAWPLQQADVNSLVLVAMPAPPGASSRGSKPGALG